MSKSEYSLTELGQYVGAECIGDAQVSISGLADIASAQANHISFLSSSKYHDALSKTQAGAVLLKSDDADKFDGNKLIVADPYYAFAVISALFETRKAAQAGIHPSALVDDSAEIGEHVSIGARCVIGAGVKIGANTEIAAGVVIGDEVQLGSDCLIHPNTVIYHQTVIGHRVTIHANTTIAADGFGFAPSKGTWKKIHQLGRVVIGNDVEIGANTTIDRGALEDTVIDDHVIIDNQVHIAHNCRIGSGTAIAGCAGIAGSTTVGKNCLIGGAVSMGGHLEIADGTMFNGATVVTRGNKEGGVFGSAAPIQPVAEWRKNSARYRQLDSLFKRLSKLEKTLSRKEKTES